MRCGLQPHRNAANPIQSNPIQSNPIDQPAPQGVAIRDIKLDNLLLSPIPNSKLPQPILKICDFGYSKSDERLHAYSKVGTLSYIAPEVRGRADAVFGCKGLCPAGNAEVGRS